MLRNSSLAAAVTGLDEKLRRETKQHLFWSRFMGNIQKVENNNNDLVLAPTGKPIEVNNMINSPGLGDRMLIPMTMELAGLGRLGDAVMLGHEEDIARKFAMVHYNMLRHGVPLQKGEQEYSLDELLLELEDNVGKLGWWHAQMENWQIATALYLGTAEMLHTATTDATYGQGLGLDKRLHPNTYFYNTSGGLEKVNSGSGYPTGAELYADVYTSSDGLTMVSAALRKARTLCYSTLNMKPMFVHNGKKYWGIVVDPVQAESLMADAMFSSSNVTAPLTYGLADHPLVTGSLGVYGNFIVFEDPVAVRGYYTADTGTSWDVTGTLTPYSDSTNKANPRFSPMTGMTKQNGGAGTSNRGAIIMGGSMLGKAVKSELKFRNEEFDYGNWKGLAAGAKYGYERLDYIPESQTPTYNETTTSSATPVYNRSSAIVITFQD